MKTCKPKPCKECGNEFQPRNSLQVVCNSSCAYKRVRRIREQSEARVSKKAKSAEKRALRARKEQLKSKSDWLREAQTVFNLFIRERDKNHGCISCSDNVVEQARGGNYDAGHYRSRGSAPELRFNEDNCFKQCKKCNRQLSGNVVEMRKGILTRIGEERLAMVEGNHEPLKLTIDDIKKIKAYYREQLKLLMG